MYTLLEKLVFKLCLCNFPPTLHYVLQVSTAEKTVQILKLSLQNASVCTFSKVYEFESETLLDMVAKTDFFLLSYEG